MSIVMKKCPICSSSLSVKVFNGGKKTLSTLGWPSTHSEAISMEKYPLDYVQCLRCSHIWNCQFNYEVIPYENNPNRMFNNGTLWQKHIKAMIQSLNKLLPKNPTVIDIGCGEGHFVRGLAEANCGTGRFLGFDPNSAPESGAGIEFIPNYFLPEVDIKRYQPDLVIMRHVLEHLEEPAEFLEQLAFASLKLNKSVYFFAETPSVDVAFKSGRIVDFFYEHPSQFTKKSFVRLMELGGDVQWVDTHYGGEVVNGLIKLSMENSYVHQAQESEKFLNFTEISKLTLASDLNKLSLGEQVTAIWGGTGKAATFIQHYQLEKNKFPYVVDSDYEKVGSFVPGTGQVIRHSSELKSRPAEVIIIPSQWRAADIYAEIKMLNVTYSKIFIEYQGRLIDYELDEHPYHA